MKRVMFATMLAVACAAGSVAAEQQQATPSGATGSVVLGTVRIGRNVTADGKPLKAGSYQVRLTAEEAKPEVAGTDAKLERWVEFTQRGQLKGREVVSIVPQAEIGQVADGKPPRPGASKVELLKGNDYLRVWINKGGTHYLIHLPTGAAATN
jgi:opacity protein-like surface antigen